MNMATPVQLAVDVISTGVALADPDTWEIVYENPQFREWLPFQPGLAESLGARLVGIDVDRAKSRLDRGRPYKHETEFTKGARSISIQVELRTQDIEGEPYLVAEAKNISKQKEAEYMLDSYSRMVEKKTREVQKEKERVEKLLLNVMPRSVYEELKEYGTNGAAGVRRGVSIDARFRRLHGNGDLGRTSSADRRAERHLHGLRSDRRIVRMRAHQDDRRRVHGRLRSA